MSQPMDTPVAAVAPVPDEIMIVDDTPENLKLLSTLLVEQGYRVRPATSGAMALRSAAAKAPELILLDVRMPEMDGYTVCRQLKADARLSAVPVIFISAMDEISDKINGFDAGAVDYLTKPFAPSEVMARVRTHLDLAHLRQRQEEAQAELERQVAVRTAELAAANRALEEKEERLRLVFEATSDGLWDWGVASGTMFFSDRWYAMLGYAADAFSPSFQAWRELVNPDDIANFEGILEEHTKGHVAEFEAEFRMRNAQGQWQWVQSRGKVTARDPDGKAIRMVGTHVDINARKRAEAQIAAALSEKEVLLKEISHRVKNNLQVVSSLLNMQANSITDSDMRVILNESANRVRSIAMVHEQLYRSEDLSTISYPAYVKQLVEHLSIAFDPQSRRIPIRAEIDDMNLRVEIAVPLGLIITELISNAYRHAFADDATGEIRVGLANLPNGEVELTVRDTGRGLPAGDKGRAGSLGLRLVSMLTDQLEGRLAVTSPDGACFTVTFNPAGQAVTHMNPTSDTEINQEVQS